MPVNLKFIKFIPHDLNNQTLTQIIMNNVFSDFDFSSLDSSDFKEDSVLEDLILPMLKELGYSSQSDKVLFVAKRGGFETGYFLS